MGGRLNRERPVERISPEDLTNLAVDDGSVPMAFGAVLLVEGGAAGPPSAAQVRELLLSRLTRVPRLRQRLVRPARGLGRPYWVDDPEFDIGRHVAAARLDGSGGDVRDRLLALASELVRRRLPLDRPPWAAAWVEGLPGNGAALVLVVHHVLADGVGGLAVLGALADPAVPEPAPTGTPPPEPPPTRQALAADVARTRVEALRALPARVRSGIRGLRELGLATAGPRLAPPTSLNRPTGPHRRLTTTSVPLSRAVRSAHAHAATVNDVVLTAVVGALARLLRDRGETPEALVVSVPVSSRRSTGRLGNASGVIPVRLPLVADPSTRLTVVSRITASRRGRHRGTSAGPLGLAFRALARAGVFQWFIAHQRLVTTFVTNVRGPTRGLGFAGCRVVEVVPMAVNPGNVGVSFDVLSYAGTLVVTVVADPDVVPEQDRLTAYLAEELEALLRAAGAV